VEDRTTKARILDRAYQLAGLDGLQSLTIGRLAGELAMSKAGLYGHFGSKQALQLETIRYARAEFLHDVVTPAEAIPDGVPRLWAMCAALLDYSAETGLHGGDFWVTVFHEYASRGGPVRDAVQATMNWWMRQLEDLVSAGVRLEHLTPCDPAQAAFEIQALLGAGSHQYRLRRQPQAIARARTAVLQRLQTLRAPQFPALAQTQHAATEPPAPKTRSAPGVHRTPAGRDQPDQDEKGSVCIPDLPVSAPYPRGPSL
jgi:AcrR family transcriptional regulator